MKKINTRILAQKKRRAKEKAKNKQRTKTLRKVKLVETPIYPVPIYTYLCSFGVTGMQFYKGFHGKVGDTVWLKPIDDNAYDSFAIQVLAADTTTGVSQVGWFPRETHPIIKERYAGKLQISLHRLLKAGIGYRATVQEIRPFAGIIVRLEIAK